MEAASFKVKSIPGMLLNIKAPSKVIKIPIWAAAPSSAVLGLAIMGPKSVKAPTPIKIIKGNMPVSIPTVKT